MALVDDIGRGVLEEDDFLLSRQRGLAEDGKPQKQDFENGWLHDGHFKGKGEVGGNRLWVLGCGLYAVAWRYCMTLMAGVLVARAAE